MSVESLFADVGSTSSAIDPALEVWLSVSIASTITDDELGACLSCPTGSAKGSGPASYTEEVGLEAASDRAALLCGPLASSSMILST